MPTISGRGDEYTTWIGAVFIFNLIVGTGALTLPAAFAKAGYVLGLVVLIFLAFTSYMTVTYVIETMACANALTNFRKLQYLKRDRGLQPSEERGGDEDTSYNEGTSHDVSDSSLEHAPLLPPGANYYSLDNKIELGEMATLFFNEFGRIVFYICLAIYLYGDLSIYSAAVAKSLRDVVCISNSSSEIDMSDDSPCWKNSTLSRLNVYRIALLSFVVSLGPFVFFNVQKTKYIQMATISFRWLAFTVMISIAIHRLIVNGPNHDRVPANFREIPSLFGACVYSFMCHHSLPSLLTPISDKNRIKSLLGCDYFIICLFYLFLALTGTFAFNHLEDLYTLNFVPTSDQRSLILEIVEYFLALFPVFTLSASFPIIAITLRNNLQTLFLDMTRFESYNFLQRKCIFPLLAISPPIIITYFTSSVTDLVGFTGSYAGTIIQYLIPVTLVYSARRTCKQVLGQGVLNSFRSPFQSRNWLIFVFIWAVACVIFATINLFTKSKAGS